MLIRFIFPILTLLIVTAVASSCPKNDASDIDTSEADNIGIIDGSSPQPPVEPDIKGDIPADTEGDSAENADTDNGALVEDGEADGTGDVLDAPVWRIDDVEHGEALNLAIGLENTLIMRFELARNCHFNDETPLSVIVTFVPDGIKVEPLEYAFESPADIPDELVFKITGVTENVSGDLAFDSVAFFCSDEGFCIRQPDSITLRIEASEDIDPAMYILHYPLDPDA
ncbi:hypothetical protein J7K50_00185 [bacterium]|nr:hypothetical protein [bacterium]